jgi:transposase
MAPQSFLHPWLSNEQLLTWLREAPDKASYQRRLTIWLTHFAEFSPERVAEMLGVSTRAVAKWVGTYNGLGPDGLRRERRGGRRWGLLSLEEERAFLADYLAEAPDANSLTASRLRAALSRAIGRQVSLGYVYTLLHRHHWSRQAEPQPTHRA